MTGASIELNTELRAPTVRARPSDTFLTIRGGTTGMYLDGTVFTASTIQADPGLVSSPAWLTFVGGTTGIEQVCTLGADWPRRRPIQIVPDPRELAVLITVHAVSHVDPRQASHEKPVLQQTRAWVLYCPKLRLQLLDQLERSQHEPVGHFQSPGPTRERSTVLRANGESPDEIKVTRNSGLQEQTSWRMAGLALGSTSTLVTSQQLVEGPTHRACSREKF